MHGFHRPTVNLKVMLLDGGVMPVKANDLDAGLDLHVPADVFLGPGDIRKIPIGIATEFTPGWCAVIKDRSSLGAKGVHVLGGVIDSQYRGQWAVVLANLSGQNVWLKAGDRIAQAIFLPVPALDIEQVDNLASSERGSGGFGSTGR